jgi:hypothetical protein
VGARRLLLLLLLPLLALLRRQQRHLPVGKTLPLSLRRWWLR